MHKKLPPKENPLVEVFYIYQKMTYLRSAFKRSAIALANSLACA